MAHYVDLGQEDSKDVSQKNDKDTDVMLHKAMRVLCAQQALAEHRIVERAALREQADNDAAIAQYLADEDTRSEMAAQALREQIDNDAAIAQTLQRERSTLSFQETTAASASAQQTTASAPGIEETESCQICYCDYEAGQEVRFLPCVHKFHTDCINQWLKIKKICPICRSKCGEGS